VSAYCVPSQVCAGAGKREDAGNVGVTFGPDNRFRIGNPADDRRGGPSLSAAHAVAHIRRNKLEMAAERPGGASLCDVVREFTPNWFSVTMGTGALALALNQMPLLVPAIYDLAGGLWLLDILLFVLFTAIYAARWICLFDEARRILGAFGPVDNPRCDPHGARTINNGLLIFGRGPDT
jgi:hypothetical protein